MTKVSPRMRWGRPRSLIAKVTVTYRIETEVRDTLKAFAFRHGVYQGDVVSVAVREYVARNAFTNTQDLGLRVLKVFQRVYAIKG